MNRKRTFRTFTTLVALGAVLAAKEAAALQPLETFLGSAQTKGFDNREAKAISEQRGLEADTAKFRLFPTLGASLAYTYNQVAIEVPFADPNAPGGFRQIINVPANQIDANFTATVPVVDVAAWERIGAAAKREESGKTSEEAVRLETERQIARAFYQLIALEAVVKSAEISVDVAQKNLEFLQKRKAAGIAPELDVKRATAEVERNKQQLTDAKYQVVVARRNLATLSGIEPTAGAPELVASLDPEAPLSHWQHVTEVDQLPQVRSAVLSAEAAQREARATRYELLPTISLTANERLTNQTGFIDRNNYFTLQALATWRFDLTRFPAAGAQAAGADAATARADKQRALAMDTIVNAWHAVEAAMDKARAARVQQEAAQLAATLSRQRYEAGAATYLDVVSTDRERFAADVARVQADTEVIYARAALRIAAGKSLLEKR
jgi:outer membrane protein TolC